MIKTLYSIMTHGKIIMQDRLKMHYKMVSTGLNNTFNLTKEGNSRVIIEKLSEILNDNYRKH
jgi:hypothetical protein